MDKLTFVSLEALNSRRLFADIVINGTSGADSIKLYYDHVQPTIYIDANVNGTVTKYSSVNSITINAGTGNDNVDISYTDHVSGYYISRPQTVNGGDGDDVLKSTNGSVFMHGDAGNDELEVGVVGPGADGATLKGDAGNDQIYIRLEALDGYGYGGTGSDIVDVARQSGAPATLQCFAYQNDAANTRDYLQDTLDIDATSYDHGYISAADNDLIL